MRFRKTTARVAWSLLLGLLAAGLAGGCGDDDHPATPGDTTPPELVSIDPPSGAVLPASGAVLTLTFSEPVDQDDLEPARMNLQAVYYLGEVSGTWNADGTVWTIPLPDLPPGLPIHVVFDHLTDLAGNVNPEDIAWDAVVEGTPAYAAVLRDVPMGYYGRWADEDNPVPQWNREWSRWVADTRDGTDLRNEELGTDPHGAPVAWDYFTLTDTHLLMRGTHDEDGDAWLDPVVDYMHLPPVPESWSGTATATGADGTSTVHYAVQVLTGTEDVSLPAEGEVPVKLARDDDGPGELYWSDCRVAILSYTVEAAGVTVGVGADTLWLAPAVGLVQRAAREEDPVEGSWYWERRVLDDIEE